MTAIDTKKLRDARMAAWNFVCRAWDIQDKTRHQDPLKLMNKMADAISERDIEIDRQNELLAVVKAALECAQETLDIEGVTCLQVEAALKRMGEGK